MGKNEVDNGVSDCRILHTLALGYQCCCWFVFTRLGGTGQSGGT